MRGAEQVRYLVLAAQREGNRQLTRELGPHGLTPAQAEAIRILGDHAPLTLNGLGKMLVCESGSSPSRLVDRLVGAGLVERTGGVVDRRNVTLALTPRGRGVEASVRTVEERLYGRIEGALSVADLDMLIERLARLSEGSPAGDALRTRMSARTVASD